MSLRVWLPLENDLTNNGATSVSVTNNGATVATDGKIGNCYRFNKNAYISIDKEAASTITSGEASFCLFLKVNSFNEAWDTYVQLGLGTAPWVAYTMGLLRDNTASNLVFVISNGSSATNDTYKTPNIAPGVWYHIACVYKPGHCLIYINGKLYADNATTIVPNFSGITAISLGGLSSTYKSDSFISDFRIYDHALSDTEVKKISDMHNELSLICHIPLDKIDSGSTVYDISGYGNNGTLSASKPTITSGAPKKYNSSMLFANDKYISISIPNITSFANSYTFAWWGKCTVYEGKMYWGFSNGNRLNLFGTGGGYCWNTGDGATNKFTGAIFAHEIDGNWHHFAVTGNGTSTKLYIDGGLRANAITYQGITGTNIILNGWDTTNDYNFNGQLSDFRIYALALSEEEIFELYNTTNHLDLNSTIFTDAPSFNDTSDLHIKKIHLKELQKALNKLDTYNSGVDNCGYVNCCESCQDACICQSDTCQWCQNACIQCSDYCQWCQNVCYQCSDYCQWCQNVCWQCSDYCQSCQHCQLCQQ